MLGLLGDPAGQEAQLLRGVAAGFGAVGDHGEVVGGQLHGLVGQEQVPDDRVVEGLGAEIELISADQVDEAYERVLASDVRYRFVIDAATLG